MIRLLIKEFTNSNRAISAVDGEKVFQQIITHFKNNETVILDFAGIELTITAFLNSSIGKLYGVYTSDQIKQLLDIENLNNDEKRLLKLVVEKAKERFSKYKNFNDDNIDVVNES
jgi:hypothetical protein